jgi:tetratricopeptide (TPR) repeat protein
VSFEPSPSRTDIVPGGPAHRGALDRIPPELHRRLRMVSELQRAGKFAEAEVCCEQVLRDHPEHADSWNLFGVLALQMGRHEDGTERIGRAIQLKGDAGFYHINLGGALRRLGRSAEAQAAFERAIAIADDSDEPHLGLALALMDQGRREEALLSLERAIAIDPECLEALTLLGDLQLMLGQPAKALPYYQAALLQNPDMPEILAKAGGCLLGAERASEAIEALKKALLLNHNLPDAHNMLGSALKISGHIAEAVESIECAIGLRPGDPRFYLNLSDCVRFTAKDSRLAALEGIDRNRGSLAPEEETALHFALGKAYGDLGRHNESFDHFIRGNAIKRRTVEYNELEALDRLRQATSFVTEKSARLTPPSVPDSSFAPIFVLGMPRSGTTLIEQILASHPRVLGAGETNEFSRVAGEFRAALADSKARSPADPAGRPASFPIGPEDGLAVIGKRYVESIRSTAPCSSFVVDKTLMNIVFIGLITITVPNARIIHVQRDPVDCCMSCFTKLFENGPPYSYDLGELGRFYRAYEKMMEGWRQVLPEGILLDLKYEDLVENPKSRISLMLEHCGLEWSDACLAFHETRREVRTASNVQVRKPLYRDAIGKGRAYGELLRPLMESLKA